MGIAAAVKGGIQAEEKAIGWWRYSSFIVVAFVLMVLALIYVWSHIRMTQLEYQVAAEINRKEQLQEEQRKLKVEMATLKSPQRIEPIARDTLQMTYPDREQVIFLK